MEITRIARVAVAAIAAAALGAPLLTSPASADPVFAPPSAADLVAHDFTLYFANAGAATTDSVAAGDHLGLYQTVTDQPYGPEAATGARWGFVADQASNPVASASTTPGISGNAKPTRS